MFDTSLGAVCSALNQYLRNRFGITKDKVKLSSVIRSDGGQATDDAEKIAVTLVGIQQEYNIRNSTPNLSDMPIHLNLSVLFSVYFGEDGNYEQSLKELSAIISFFQANHVLTHQNAPDLPADLDKLVFKLENQNWSEQQNMWATLGGKHVPSVVYRVSMVMISEGNSGLMGRVGTGF